MQNREEREREEREAAYWGGPVGQAVLARRRGQRFYQVELPVQWVGAGPRQVLTKAVGTPETLEQIEDVGWELEHAGFVFLEVDKSFVTGQGGATHGSVMGIYLFRATQPGRPPNRREGQ